MALVAAEKFAEPREVEVSFFLTIPKDLCYFVGKILTERLLLACNDVEIGDNTFQEGSGTRIQGQPEDGS